MLDSQDSQGEEHKHTSKFYYLHGLISPSIIVKLNRPMRIPEHKDELRHVL